MIKCRFVSLTDFILDNVSFVVCVIDILIIVTVTQAIIHLLLDFRKCKPHMYVIISSKLVYFTYLCKLTNLFVMTSPVIGLKDMKKYKD